MPDIINFQHKTSQDCFDLCKDFNFHNGVPPKDEFKVWETVESMKKRIDKVLGKYTNYQRVIVVSHEMLIKTVSCQKQIEYAEIIEYYK